MNKAYVFPASVLAAGAMMVFATCQKTPKADAPRVLSPEQTIVPKPMKVQRQEGVFPLDAAGRIAVPAGEAEFEAAARYLSDRLRTAFGIELPVTDAPPVEATPLLFLSRGGRAELGPEGYEISVTPAAVSITANSPAGAFYGIQSLLQLLPPEAFGSARSGRRPLTIPCVRIEDKPRLPWRGMLLDVSRHFFPKEFVKSVIDDLAVHKMNVFHLHLTDDQGWRLEIKKYPRLTEIGAWRVDREDRLWNDRPAQKPGEKATYGGFYTQDDVREVLAYAAGRHVTVVPEIEMPGHCLSVLAAYPELSCAGGPFTVPPGGYWPIKDVYCPGNEKTFKFLEDVLTEVIALFPGEYIHIGGDEVDKSTWKSCPKCRARMKKEGLQSEEELQSWFIRRIERFLNARGRKIIGWDEILEGGLAPKAAVMSWRGNEGGIAAAKAGHPVVMTPTSNCYFDYYQGDAALEPLAIGGYVPLRKVYSFEPVPPELSAAEGAYVIGVQANLWTEYIATASQARYMTFPRIAAMAEAGWTARENRDWADFSERLETQLLRYEALGIGYARSMFAVKLVPSFDPETKRMRVGMEAESFRPDIRFTLDGSTPAAASKIYAEPLVLKKSSTVKAGVFSAGKLRGPVTETAFFIHSALGRTPIFQFPYRDRYDAGGSNGLVDGLRGGKSHTDGRWQGFEGDDLVATIDLGRKKKLEEVQIGFLQKIDSWIFFPRSVEVAVSDDGKDFTVVGTFAFPVRDKDVGVLTETVRLETGKIRARFVRVTAVSIRTCPEEHSAAGGKGWLFADEIVIN
jgi:hexosaminidase